MRTMKSIIFLAPALLVLAGCSTTGAVSQADLEQQVSTQLESSVGVAPDSVTCPGDLTAETGTTMRCELTAGDSTYGLTVTVTGVENDVASFDILVDDAPQ